MAFSYTADLQNAIAYAVFNVPYSTLTANQKAQLDGTASPTVAWNGTNIAGVAGRAAVEVGQLAQWFEQASSAPNYSFPTPAWDRLFIAKAAMILSQTARPDRYQQFRTDHETALDETVDTYTRDLVSATSLAGQDIKLIPIRAYVIDRCVKRTEVNTGLRRRLFPQISQIDAETQWAINYLWNFKPWHFRKRQVIVRIVHSEIEGATWTESTKTLTDTGAFTDTRIGAGSRVLITGGTNVYAGEYVVASRTSDDAIVLDTSLSQTGGNLTTGDIAGVVQAVSLQGMHFNETFDSIVSRRLYYDGDFAGNVLTWCDSNDMAMNKASNGTNVGMPARFRWEKYDTGYTWHFSPFPDDDYELRGAVTVTGVGTLSTSASLDTAIARFPAEFGPILRDLVLGRVLMSFGASDGERVYSRAIDQCSNLLPIYADQGYPTRQTAMEDVYDDYRAIQTERWD